MSRKKILIVEPQSRNTYPPLGLMKLSTYHKLKGDSVQYVYGKDEWSNGQYWDVIYISSMFTWDFKELVATIKYYSENLFNFKNIKVGGVSATLLCDEIEALTGIVPTVGTLDCVDPFLEEVARNERWANYLNDCSPCIDYLPPDYSVSEYREKYKKLSDDAYMMYATKGCPNTCSFCAVNTLEPKYVDYIPIKPRVDYIRNNFGEKRGMLFLDNNIAASDEFDRIIDEIKDCGFVKGGKLNKKKMYVDFNQGVDARRLTEHVINRFSELCIDPLRIAFDNINMERIYSEKVIMSIDKGINKLSNYILYNHKDLPEDLYKRLKINIDINVSRGAKIFSFPMKFIPLHAKDRTFVGEYWTRRQIRAIQLIMNVTRGIVSAREDFFYHAFGYDEDEYNRILLMPQNYIFYRVKHEKSGDVQQWHKEYCNLTRAQREKLFEIIKDGRLKEIPVVRSKKLASILEHYEGELKGSSF